MTKPLSANRRAIYPPAICKKPPNLLPPTPAPSGPIYAQVTGKITDWGGTIHNIAQRFRCIEESPGYWIRETPDPTLDIPNFELYLALDEKTISAVFDSGWTGHEDPLMFADNIPIDLPGPFHAGPVQVMLDEPPVSLLIELSAT
jgi:hypothetical protein